ncbi:hypothetical protein [Corynebacterium sp.]|uniref:hypothetical protein n=1 Tax=Corynebacterium sp. TaxID=1720 RepID=UPI002632EC91|nr:hypothetical protein [Corynebacterium sp.]
MTGLRAAGTDARPASKENRDNTLSMLARANVADAVYCTADAANKTLTSTTVALRDTQTEFDETSTDLEVTSGEAEVTLKALVKGTDGQPITEGKVEFDLGDGQRRTVDVRDGVAECATPTPSWRTASPSSTRLWPATWASRGARVPRRQPRR